MVSSSRMTATLLLAAATVSASNINSEGLSIAAPMAASSTANKLPISEVVSTTVEVPSDTGTAAVELPLNQADEGPGKRRRLGKSSKSNSKQSSKSEGPFSSSSDRKKKKKSKSKSKGSSSSSSGGKKKKKSESKSKGSSSSSSHGTKKKKRKRRSDIFSRHKSAVSESDGHCHPDNCPFCVGDNNSWCEQYGGQCQDAVQAFLAGDVTKAKGLLHYGKYCGLEQRCSKNEGCDDQPDACADGVDQACFDHDNCLDEAIKKLEDKSEICFDPESGHNIPPEERIACDSAFVSTLYDISASSSFTGSGPTGLCDEPFYNPDRSTGAGIHLVGHEAILMAVPYCTDTLFPEDGSGCAKYEETEGCFPKAFYLCCSFNVNFQYGGNPPDGAVEETCGPPPSS